MKLDKMAFVMYLGCAIIFSIKVLLSIASGAFRVETSVFAMNLFTAVIWWIAVSIQVRRYLKNKKKW